MKRLALLLLLATTALGGEKPEVALMEFQPAIPKRLAENECWPIRARIVPLVSGEITARVEAFAGDALIYDGVASAKKIGTSEEYELQWPLERACRESDPRSIHYRLTIRVNEAPAAVARSSYGAFPQLLELPPIAPFPPPPPPLPGDAFDQGCDLHLLSKPIVPVTLDAASAEVTAYRVDYRKGTRRFHGMHVARERKVSPAIARRIVEILNDSRNYACSGAACLNVGMAFRIHTLTGSRDLGICLECHYLHDLEPNERTPLSERGVKELTKIYETLFK